MIHQKAFANIDLEILETNGVRKVLPLTNVNFKGYQVKAVAWKSGKQHVLQPDWAESDKHLNSLNFTIQQLIWLAIKGMCVCKRAWFMSRG